MEQKNWPVVRQNVGYARYDTPEEHEALNELYEYLRPYVNFLQLQMKLVSKIRRGAKVTKRFDVATTPYQRVLASPNVSQEAKAALTRRYLGLNRAELKRRITACQDQLLELNKAYPGTARGGDAPTRPPLQADDLLEGGFEDIFSEATGGGYEDILK